MIHEFIGASLAANKIIDQGASIKKLRSTNKKLVNDYNLLLEGFNRLRNEFDKVVEREKEDFSNSNSMLNTVMEQRDEAQKQAKYYKEQVDNTTDKANGLEREIEELREEQKTFKNMNIAVQMMLARVTSKVPKDDLIKAVAETFADNSPESLKKEFHIQHTKSFEPTFIRNFVGNSETFTKYYDVKKKMLDKRSQAATQKNDADTFEVDNDQYSSMGM